MRRLKTRHLLLVLALCSFLWGVGYHRKVDSYVPRPVTPFTLADFDSSSFDHAAHVEVEVDWLTELGERMAWNGMRLAERFSRGVVFVAHDVRALWDGSGSPPEPLHPVRTVVVDPGHGGRDPGATGIGGLHEKAVTLRLSRLLRTELESRGFRVITTRYGDQTVSLRRRIEIAEKQDGDLFVSLHANATKEQEVRGILTFYPDKNYTRHVQRAVAESDGAAASLAGSDAGHLLEASFAQTSDLSADLAESVHERLVSGVREEYRSVSDLGVRSGDFYVLFLPSMPALLLEVGFLTHREEAARMQSDAYLSLLATSIADGITGYRDAGKWDPPRTTASRSPSGEPAT